MAKGAVRIPTPSRRRPSVCHSQRTLLSHLVQHGFRHFNCARPKYSSAASSPSGILRPNSLRCPRRGRGLLCRASVCKILASHFVQWSCPTHNVAQLRRSPLTGNRTQTLPRRVYVAQLRRSPHGQPHPDVAPLITPLGPRRRRRWAASSTPPPSSSSAPRGQEIVLI